jgi:hypothetical protein
MTRMRRGWELTKQSWAIVRRDRSLMVFPVVAVISALLVALIFIGAASRCTTRTTASRY